MIMILTKRATMHIVQNQIEKQMLLKLYPFICLKPIQVMQVLNYVHYEKNQNIVRSQFNHTQIAKMKSYYYNNQMDIDQTSKQ